MSYRDDLEHPKWQQKRLRIFERDGWRCVACGADDIQLHAHHTAYTKGAKPWEYDDDIIVTLCKNCHHNAHWIDRIEGEVMGIVIPWTFEPSYQACKPYRWTGRIEREDDPDRDTIYYVVDFQTGEQMEFQGGDSRLFRKPPEISKSGLHQWIAECWMLFETQSGAEWQLWEEERAAAEKNGPPTPEPMSPAYAAWKKREDDRQTGVPF
jgi:5-methylcytosine-specific restriction endonuclease McrA